MNHHNFKKTILSLLLAASAAGANLAHANKLEEVIITAQKRAESLQLIASRQTPSY